MIYLGRFSDLKYWSDDDQKLGRIPVLLDGETFVARASNSTGALYVPTQEFVTKYGDYLWVLLQKTEDQEYYTWTGFATVLDLPSSLSSDPDFTAYVNKYPYVRLYFTENWHVVVDDSSGSNSLTINHVDGTYVKVDRSSGNESVMVSDAVTGSTITLTKDLQITVQGDVTLNVPTDNHVYVGGSGGDELATKTFVSQIYNTHTHATPTGPSGPPVIASPLTPGSDITKKAISE